MIPFANTCPYEIVGHDLYVLVCPFCGAERVLLPMRRKDLQPIRDGRKKLLVFPCCHASVTVIDCDADYLLADRPVRKL